MNDTPNYSDVQQHSYWTRDSFTAIDREHVELIKSIESVLPAKYCIVNVDLLPEIDDLQSILQRMQLAESKVHELQRQLDEMLVVGGNNARTDS